MKFFLRLLFIIYLSVCSTCCFLLYLSPIFTSNNIYIPFSLSHFDICTKYPVQWFYIKITYIVTNFISFFLILNSIFSYLNLLFNITVNRSKKSDILPNNNYDFSVFIGKNSKNLSVFLPIISLYQNILCIGSIGSGKTSSLLYPITSDLLSLNFSNEYNSAFLILDVKGNYHKFVKKVCIKYHHLSDLFIISIDGFITYNPLDKPNLKPHVLAHRLTDILLLFSPEQTESFWIDKAEQVLTEAIRLCRLYNSGYVTFVEIHKIIMSHDYYQEKVNYTKELFYSDSFSENDISDLISCISFFDEEFFSLDDRTISIIKSDITRITGVFVSDADVSRIFCPDKNNISFPGFEYILAHHKIVVLDMNLSMYSSLAKIISAYLKIDFQAEILMQLAKNDVIYPSCFICDEYHEYVTKNDATFLAQSREAKSINIVATQSYSSLLNTLKDQTSTRVLIQNFVNKFWFRTDDSFTVDEILKQTGKEEKEIISHSISENAKQTNYNFIFNSFSSKDSNISESVNTSSQRDFIFDSNFFSRELETFSCLAFLSNGNSILPVEKLYLTPYFKRKDVFYYEK